MSDEMKKYLRTRVTTKAFIFDPETKKFLFARAADMKEEYWKLIGGRMEEGEQPTDALIRELTEEIGKDVTYEIVGTIGSTVIPNDDSLVTIVGYLVLYRGGEIQLNEEHSEYKWLTYEEVMSEKNRGEWATPFFEEAQKRLEEVAYLNDLKRLQADFDNYKKRQQESQKELGGYLIEKLILDIVPVLDNFRSATMHVPPEQKDSPWVVGIQYIEKQLETVLVDNGVTPIDAEPGEAFDPNLHEAVGTEEGGGESVEESGHKIAKVLQKGYKVGTKVVRPARVSVS